MSTVTIYFHYVYPSYIEDLLDHATSCKMGAEWEGDPLAHGNSAILIGSIENLRH